MKTKTTLDLRKVSLLSRKKVKIIAGVLAVAVVSGGILVATGMVQANYKGIINFFSKVTGTANVSQSIKLDDHVYGVDAAWTYTADDIVAGETVFNGPHFIRNTASVPIKVTLETDPNPGNLNPSPVERVWHNVQITTGAEYVRNPSFFKASDGAYWLFYTQDTNTSQNGYGCDAGALSCDSDTYDVYYTISLDQGETWSGPIALAKANSNNTNKRRDVSVFQDSAGKIWVFVADGASPNNPVFYLSSSDNGATWSSTTAVSGIKGNHISALEVNSYIVLFFNSNAGNQIKLVYTSDSGSTWSSKVTVDTRGGVMKAIHGSDSKIKVVWENTGSGIYMSTCDDSTFGTASNWSTTAGPIVQTVVSGYGDYDPYLYQDTNGKYWLFYAPWDASNTTRINYITSANGTSWSQPKILMERTGLWNFWPMVSEDDSGHIMVFYASENNYNISRVNGNIWLAKSGNWWHGNVPMEITIPANEWIGADISNVFKDDTGANAYSTVTTVKK